MTQKSRHWMAGLGVTVAMTACSHPVATAGSSHQSARPLSRVASAPATANRTVAFHGITIALPTGWTVARPHCGPPANDTLVIGRWTGSCPAGPGHQVTTGVSLTSLYGRQFALNWPGHRLIWRGQPAWLARQSEHGTTIETLTLPWLNAVVATQSGDAARARSLLGLATARPEPGLAVPARASSVFIQSLAGRDRDHRHRDADITNPREVRRLLSDLRNLPLVTSPARACNGSWWPNTAILSVHAVDHTRTYVARFDRCGLVIAGTGSAGETSQRLESDVKRVLPNSAF
jgi:hypothetical protein